MDPIQDAIAEIQKINEQAQAQGRKIHDDWDASYVEAIRKNGAKVGNSTRVTERRVKKYLKKRGY